MFPFLHFDSVSNNEVFCFSCCSGVISQRGSLQLPTIVSYLTFVLFWKAACVRFGCIFMELHIKMSVRIRIGTAFALWVVETFSTMFTRIHEWNKYLFLTKPLNIVDMFLCKSWHTDKQEQNFFFVGFFLAVQQLLCCFHYTGNTFIHQSDTTS